jgi:hypothetical protein
MEVAAMFASLKRQAEKYYSLICFERKTLFLLIRQANKLRWKLLSA